MNELCERHGIALDDEDAPAWGDYSKLPHVRLVAELADAAERVAGELREARKRFATEHRSGVSYHDANWEGGLEGPIRRELEGLTEGQRVDIAAMCFASAKRRAKVVDG